MVGFATGSLAILSEAGHSLIDLGATVMTYFAVRISGKPADEEHHYGHGKVESVSALAETALLFLLSGVVIWEAVKRLTEHEAHVVDRQRLGLRRDRGIDRGRFLPRARAVAHRQADAEPGAGSRRAAFFVRSVVLAGRADRAGRRALRLAVGGFGRRAGGGGAGLHRRLAARPAHHRHADRHGAGRRRRKITAIAAKVAGVVAVEHVRARAVGDKIFIDLTVAVSRTLPLDRVSAIKDAVAAAIREQMPGAEPTVTTDPVALNNETVLDRVMVIARNRALAVHHVTVHDLKDRLAVSLDLEVDGKLSLRAAHDMADGLESAIAGELGAERRGRDPYRAAAAAPAPPAARRRPSA